MSDSSKKVEELNVCYELVESKIDLIKKINSRLELLEISLNKKIGFTLVERNNMMLDMISLIQIKGIIEFMPNTDFVKDLKLKL